MAIMRAPKAPGFQQRSRAPVRANNPAHANGHRAQQGSSQQECAFHTVSDLVNPPADDFAAWYISNLWTVDSGATAHITNDSSRYIIYKKFPEPRPIMTFAVLDDQ